MRSDNSGEEISISVKRTQKKKKIRRRREETKQNKKKKREKMNTFRN